MNEDAAPLGSPTESTRDQAGKFAGSRLSRVLSHGLEYYGVAFLLVPLIVVFATQNDQFLTWDNWLNILRQMSVFAILAVGMTMLMLMAQIDLSVGSVAAFAGVCAAGAFNDIGGLGAALAAGILAGTIIGLFNGTVTVAFAVPSLLVTLGSLQMIRGLAFVVTDGRAVLPTDPDAFSALGNGYWLGIPTPVWIMLLVAALGWLLLTQTAFGRHIYAIGGNREAARRAGIKVRRTLILTFGLAGALAGLAGVILASRLASGQPNVGLGYELYVIAAVVLGGTSLFGGHGTLIGSLLGVLVIGVLQNGMQLLAISPFWQTTVIGAVIIFALVADSIRARRLSTITNRLRGSRAR